jgi:signal transduction histidine kinase
VGETINILEGQASLRRVKLVLKAECNEVQVNLDTMRTQQILLNLISNAIKFS